MANLSKHTDSAAGGDGRAVPYTFTRHEDGRAGHLVLVFPGWNYTADMPLLYYPTLGALWRGADVLAMGYSYSTSAEFAALDRAGQDGWLRADAEALLDVARQAGDYTRRTFLGKSIGTRIMALLLDAGHTPQDAVWLTPILSDPAVAAAVRRVPRSLLVLGTADGLYDAAAWDALPGEKLLVAGGDHGLNVGNDLSATLEAQARVARAVAAFLGERLISWV